MAKKIVKKRKIKIWNFIIVLLVIVGLSFGVYYFCNVPIQNIIIKDTKYLNDDYILELGKIKDYPSFVLTRSNQLKKTLEKSPYIKKVSIKKKWGFVLVLKIKEESPIFFDTDKNKYVFNAGDFAKEDNISNSFRVPRLLNYVPDKKYKKFIQGMGNIREDTLSKISDIEYQPNDFDKDRFLLYMDDGNMVYLTLTKFKMINHYNEVLSQLENHKGILYLDNGNHFKIME